MHIRAECNAPFHLGPIFQPRALRLINVTGCAGVRPVFIFMQILNYLIRSVTRLPFLGGARPGPTGSSRGDPSLHNLNIYWLQSFREKIPHHIEWRGKLSIFHTKYFHVYNIPTSESGWWEQMTPCNDSSNRKLSSRSCEGDVQLGNILTSNAEVQQHSKDHLAFIKRPFMACGVSSACGLFEFYLRWAWVV